MKRHAIILILAISLVLGASAVAFAQGSAPSATAVPTVTAPANSAPRPSVRTQGVRPVPSILPTLRLIDAGMLPTLGFLLNMTDDQKAKALDLLNKAEEERKPKVAAQIKAAEEYIALLGRTGSSAGELTAAAQKVMAADNDLMAGRIRTFVAFRALLTPEQNKRLAEELEQSARRWLPQTQAAPASTPASAAGK